MLIPIDLPDLVSIKEEENFFTPHESYMQDNKLQPKDYHEKMIKQLGDLAYRIKQLVTYKCPNCQVIVNTETSMSRSISRSASRGRLTNRSKNTLKTTKLAFKDIGGGTGASGAFN